MGTTKTNLFDDEVNEIALLIKALAHPARISIVNYLIRTENCICNDIVAELSLAQPTVSQHLKELKNAGIIKGNISGKAICYCINPEIFNKLTQFFTTTSQRLSCENENCC